MKFKIGDIVELKSCGPAMTVVSVSGVRVVVCWFSDADLRRLSFHSDTLRKWA